MPTKRTDLADEAGELFARGAEKTTALPGVRARRYERRRCAVTAVQEDMDRVMAQSERVTLQGWRERKWYVRLLGTVLRPFAMWM